MTEAHTRCRQCHFRFMSPSELHSNIYVARNRHSIAFNNSLEFYFIISFKYPWGCSIFHSLARLWTENISTTVSLIYTFNSFTTTDSGLNSPFVYLYLRRFIDLCSIYNMVITMVSMLLLTTELYIAMQTIDHVTTLHFNVSFSFPKK